MFYKDKLESLKDIFGTTAVKLEPGKLIVIGRVYPIVDDVIILLDPLQYPPALKERIKGRELKDQPVSDFAEDIQFTFGQEWLKFPKIMPEHKEEFSQYFDLVDTSVLENSRVCDLGCGIGRWSYFLNSLCRELILVDFSEAIFVARRNLKESSRAIFFMGDLKRLPFREGFADFLFCLGVLHHLPTNALGEVRNLKKYAATLLIYLYYSLDNRSFYYRFLLSAVTAVRTLASKIRNDSFRAALTELIAVFIYCPLVGLGKIFNLFRLGRLVPLYEGYNGKGLKRIRQDVYDRFFTRIEQRVSRKDILALKDSFEVIKVSENIPYWHFLCQTEKNGV